VRKWAADNWQFAVKLPTGVCLLRTLSIVHLRKTAVRQRTGLNENKNIDFRNNFNISALCVPAQFLLN
jgi:hypothetical protein